MKPRAHLIVSCVLLLCAATIADDKKPAAQPIKAIKAKAAPVAKAIAPAKALPAEKALPAAKAVKVKVKAKAVAVNAVKIAVADKKTQEAQRKASKEYAEARKAVVDRTKELQEAEKAAEAAEGDAEKAEAAKKIAAAKDKLEKARKEQTAKLQAVRKLAVQVAARRVYIPATQNVRKTVDVNDTKERFLLLNPGGPLVVEASMTINGQPFRTAREKLIDELLAAADKDKDGKSTWEEALSTSRFTLGRIRITNEQQRAQYLKNLDKNGNKTVDRTEAREFVAMYFQGPSFMITGTNGYRGGFGGPVFVSRVGGSYMRGGQADVRKLLDKDEDGELSAEEIAGAADRLKSRDADDNDLLLPAEINGVVNRGNGNRVVVRNFSTSVRTPLTLLLGPTAKAPTLFASLQSRYKDKAGDIVASTFKDATLFKALDKNANGKLEEAEVLALNTVKPHVQMTVALGKNGKPTKQLKVESLAAGLKVLKSNDGSATLETAGINLTFSANSNAPRVYNYSQTAKSYLTRFDKDANGYLDKKEMTGNYAYLLTMWDADEDGKVYAKEIVASYDRMQAPQRTQIRAAAVNQGNSLFSVLDVSGDGRLSLREMRTAHVQIKSFDKNKNNKISSDEIPNTVAVTFGIGNAAVSYQQRRANPNQPAKSDSPDWFTRMDRNGDGDVTLKEFLGDEESFKKLDTNNDGFIEPKEAKAASKTAESTKLTEDK